MVYNKESQDKLYEYFITRLGMWRYTRGWLKGDCPYCGKKNKFGVHIIHNRTNCFRCNEHPNPIRVIMDVEGLSTYAEGWNHVLGLDGIEYLEPTLKIIDQKPGLLPESYKLISLGSSEMAHAARSNLRARGFSISKLAMLGVGYCTSGPYWGRIIFPFYQQGKLVYFTARKFIDIGQKFKNPKVEEFGIGKSLLIYNMDALAIYHKVYIVESVTNALTIGPKATGYGGKSLSEYQISKIIESPVKEVIVILDPDAYHEALWVGLRLVEHKKVKVVLLPRAENIEESQDINDLGKKAVMEYVKNTEWGTYKDLYKLYIEYPKLTIYNK